MLIILNNDAGEVIIRSKRWQGRLVVMEGEHSCEVALFGLVVVPQHDLPLVISEKSYTVSSLIYFTYMRSTGLQSNLQ